MLNLDRYAYNNGLSKVHPLEKFLFALITMLVCLLANSLVVSLLVILLMTGVSVLMGRVPLGFYLKLMLIPLAFLMVAVITIAVNIVDASTPLLWGCQVFNITIGISYPSAYLASKLFLRSLGAISCLYFLILTTPSLAIISLLGKLKCPVLLIDLMSLVYRFIFVLLDTANKIRTAQVVRLGYGNLRQGYRSLGQLVVNLYINSYRRALNLYTALEARGYQGNLRVLEEEYPVSKKNLLVIIVIDLLLVIIGRVSV